MQPLKIGIAGLGTVGVGVFRLLTGNADLYQARTGAAIAITAVSSRDASRDRGIDVSGAAWEEDALALAARDDVDVVVETIGGADGIALQLVEAALKAGKHVVTANKALIATHGASLAKLADANNIALCFEAAVAGGIPIIKNIRETLAANNYQSVAGILNGTCNYILTEMAEKSADFEDVLKDAQAKGYAETPPDLDVDGWDAAHKLVILTAIAYGTTPDLDNIYVEGIRDISQDDIRYADELGYAIRLLGISQRTDTGISQRVHPALVLKGSFFANVQGVLNGVQVQCDALGPATLTGAGAGEGPTASSVMADILDVAAKRTAPAFGRAVDALDSADYVAMDTHTGEYYLRLKVRDEKGVLASITSELSAQDVGVEKVIQNANEADQTAQIAITTHPANEAALLEVLDILAKKEYVLEPPHRIRIES